jgi:DNA helicase-2/ATP-dependent DNA helicase PcrA
VKREDLTPRQSQAVQATEPFVLVTGGAGTGKTTTALWAARQHLEREYASPVERVLFVTFSRTAVGQIASRSRAVLSGLGDRIEVHTFHSLAYRLLRAFGRYAGRGAGAIEIQSMARSRLLGRDRTRLSYDELVPGALALVASPAVLGLATQRWTLVICDEFQDTSDEQWELLHILGSPGRLLVLADPHQMIYGFINTVGAQRLVDASEAADRVVELEEASHRDPSGVIPAMAAAVRRREFRHPAVAAAVQSGRVVVRRCAGDATSDAVAAEIHHHRVRRRRTVGVFETTNAAVAELGAELTERGLDYTLIGLPEAHGEALLTMADLVATALSVREWHEAQLQLGIFLTSVTRGDAAPELARQLAGHPGMREFMRERLAGLSEALRSARHDDDALIRLAVEAWPALGIAAGVAAWRRAAVTFAALARRVLGARLADDERADALVAACHQLHLESAITSDVPLLSPVQLMNFHQTKGREADAVVLVYREGGWVTRRQSAEPFTSESRVLYVALTRAREAITILVPPNPHPFVAPLAALESGAGGSSAVSETSGAAPA